MINNNREKSVFLEVSNKGQEDTIKHFTKTNKIFTKALSPEESFVTDIEIAIANKISKDISIKTKMGLLEKAENGIYPSKPPLGYINNSLNKRIDIDNKIDKEIKELFEFLAKGNFSENDIQNVALKIGIKPCNMYRIVSNRFYYGVSEWKGKIYNGRHIPLVNKQNWIKANKNLVKK